MPNNRCNGIVTNHFPGISMVEYHHDAQVCIRPGSRDLPLGTLVESEFQIQLGLCEHTIVAIHEFAPESDEQQPKVTTFKGDEPVSEDVIKRAAIPPKIRVDLSTSPAFVQVEARKSIETELDEDEPISGNGPINPFDSRFSASPNRPPAPGPREKKESWFDSDDPRG